MEEIDNSIKQKLAYKPMTPYGFDVIILTENEALPNGFTDIKPEANIERPVFDEISQNWSSASKSVIPQPQPSSEQLAINQLGLQVATLSAKIEGSGNNV